MFQDVERALAAPDLRETEFVLLELTRERFRTQSAPDGSPWKSLSPKTLESRRRRGLDGVQALFATGALFASIEAVISPLSVTIEIGGTGQGGADSVAFHQFGDGVPARPILPLDGQIPERWLGLLADPVADQFGDRV